MFWVRYGVMSFHSTTEVSEGFVREKPDWSESRKTGALGAPRGLDLSLKSDPLILITLSSVCGVMLRLWQGNGNAMVALHGLLLILTKEVAEKVSVSDSYGRYGLGYCCTPLYLPCQVSLTYAVRWWGLK